MKTRIFRACMALAGALLIVGGAPQSASAQTCDLSNAGNIGGIVFLDANGDGVRQAGETGINGVVLTITGPSGAVTTVTSGGASSIPGFYTSVPLCEAGTYSVAVVSVPSGYTLTTPSPTSVTITRDPNDGRLSKKGNVNFALVNAPCVSSIGDRVWDDLNANGVQDAGEPGIAGVTVRLLLGGSVVQTTTTDGNGNYQFVVPCSQTYTVEVVTPPGYGVAPSDEGGDDALDSDPSGVSVPVGTNEHRTDIDFGFFKLCQGVIGDYVWHDLNRNGIQDAGEHGIEGVEVQLIQTDGAGVETVIRTDITDANGQYLFDGVCPGTYQVRVNPATVPAGYVPTLTSPPAGGTSANDSNASPSTVTLPGFSSSDLTIDFGYLTPCTGRIGDFVWFDLNRNGIQDAGEPGLAGVRVVLYAQSEPDMALAAVTADANGGYMFDGLCSGDYIVEVDPTTLPAGMTASAANQGGDDAADSDGIDHRASVSLPADDSTDLTIDFGYQVRPLKAYKTAAGSYNRQITWTLSKTVNPTSHSGKAGETVGSSTWTVTAGRTETAGGYLVLGDIVIQNENPFPVAFSVTDVLNDGTAALVNCPASTVPANDSVTCAYTASPSGATATLNTATITSSTPGVAGVSATAAVSFVGHVIGDESTTLADARFSYSQLISAPRVVTFPETFTCPTDASLYTNGTYVRTVTNTATLTGPNTSLSASANVRITCTREQWAGETAVGAGIRYPGTSNWFMYTPYSTSKIDLIAGQHYDAGDIFMSRTGSGATARTTIRIVLASGWRWADVADVLKIHPFSSAPRTYLQPGGFLYKFTSPNIAKAAGTTVVFSGNTVTVTMPGHSPRFYGIHGDVERLVQ